MYNNTKEICAKEDINPNWKSMSMEQSKSFIMISMMKPEERLDICEQIINEASPSIFNLAHKRWVHFKMQEKIDLDVLLLVDLFAEGVPGRAVFMLIDLLNKFEDTQKKVTIDTVSMDMYPMGFYSDEAVQTIVDGFVKTGKLRNSELY